MSYNEDLAAALRYEKLRIAALIAAFSCTLAMLLLEGFEWLEWPRAIAWRSGPLLALRSSRDEAPGPR